VVTALITVNIGMFVLCTLTSGGYIVQSPLFAACALYTPATLRGEVWRLLTAQYLHWDFGHILMNMLGLHFLGRVLEREWGRRRFLAVYTVAGLAGNLFYTVLSSLGWLPVHGVAAGASGCVLGLLGACAVRYPGAELLIYFLFPIKIRTAALLFGGWYALNLYQKGPNAGGDACHLAGLLFGAWWAWRGERWWSATEWRLPRRLPWFRKRSGPRVRVFGPDPRDADGEAVDRILKKVYDRGVFSLTDAERAVLRDATERLQGRTRGHDRTDRL
jgi:membrane associated rhomboid family serine protease